MEELSSPILRLPLELVLLILEFLDIRAILNIRQTCLLLNKATFEREIWIQLLKEQKTYIPLPRELLRANHLEDSHLLDYSAAEIEAAVTEAEITSELWGRSRPRPPYKLPRETIGHTLMGMKLLLDRWLLVAYFEGAAYIYDTQPHDQFDDLSGVDYFLGPGHTQNRAPSLRAALYLESGLWITHVAGIDHKGQSIFLALSRSAPPHVVQIYEISLTSLASSPRFIPNAFSQLRSISLSLYKVIRAIDPERRLVALSTAGVVEIVQWDDCRDNSEDDQGTQIISVNVDDQEGLWNGIIAVHFSDTYVLVFRTRSLEAYTYTPGKHTVGSGSETLNLKHNFNMTFREVSFSQTTISTHPASQTRSCETSLFAYDVIQGLFHYIVRIRTSISPTEEIYPSLEVVLTGVYPLAIGLNHANLYRPLMPPDSAASTPNTTYSANFTPSPSPTPISSQAHTFVSGSSSLLQQNLDGGARGFLSTHSIGSQGKRGIWVERKRSSTLREIQVWGHNSPSFLLSYKKELPTDDNVSAVEMPRRVVFSLQSFDLRDDITCCTFGELSGMIVLGHRSGDVSILDLHGDDR